MLDNRNHEGKSIREKLNELAKPSNLIKMVLVQQQEVERLTAMSKVREAVQYEYIRQLYQHYIVEGKPKLFAC